MDSAKAEASTCANSGRVLEMHQLLLAVVVAYLVLCEQIGV